MAHLEGFHRYGWGQCFSTGLHQPLNDHSLRKKSGVRLPGFRGNHCLPQPRSHISLFPHRHVFIYYWLNPGRGYVGAITAPTAEVIFTIWTWTHRWIGQQHKICPTGKSSSLGPLILCWCRHDDADLGGGGT